MSVSRHDNSGVEPVLRWRTEVVPEGGAFAQGHAAVQGLPLGGGLGAAFLDQEGNELPGGGAALARLDRVDFSRFDVRLEDARFTLASDVDNPLLGPSGAAAVFGPQKGATPGDVIALDAALTNFLSVLAGEIGVRAEHAAFAPGAGAAGRSRRDRF